MKDSNEKLARVGVDIGGTFTDVVLATMGKTVSTKVLTTATAPEQAIIDGIKQVAEKAGIAFGDIGEIIHGTTLATNALLERRGVKTALVTTEGFRDVIEMRSENRFEQYDLNITLPEPLIARADRYVVSERIGADGNVLLPLSDAEVEKLADQLITRGYQSIAIGLMHSYVNNAHERRIREILSRRMPDAAFSISSEVSPQIRELDRFNTVCANAYVKPIVSSYLLRLVDRLRNEGAACPVYIMHSGGGLMTIENASEFPVRLLESGPAGGAIFAAEIAARYQLNSVISYDMGGTTAKICLIDNQTPTTVKTFEAARTYRFKKGSGMTISIPAIDMIEIGAGGGSIASVDSLHQIRVGPESAGSEPGPAAFQRGGTRPTVTDADLLLGRLDPEAFAGGSITLSRDNSMKAAANHIGSKLDMTEEQAAFGICEVVEESMANATRVYTVENGKDIDNYTLIAFGGAAPLHAARLCKKLGIDRFLIPPGAGVGSAIGFLRAPFSFEAVHSAYTRLGEFDADAVNKAIKDLSEEASAFVRSGARQGDIEIKRVAYMRYCGQGWEIPVSVPDQVFDANSAALFKTWFEDAYKHLFGRPISDLDIEIITWSVNASMLPPPVAPITRTDARVKAKPVGMRKMFEAKTDSFVDTAVYERDQLTVGAGLSGPAVIIERETSTIIPMDYSAVMQEDGCILIQADPQ